MLHLNIQGFRDKILLLEVYMKSLAFKIHFLCLTETWLRQEDLPFCKVNGYNLVSNYCRTDMIKGSIAIYVDENIKAFPVDIPTAPIEVHCEFTCCKFLLEGIWHVIVCFYRSPGHGNPEVFSDTLEAVLEYIFCLNNTRVIVCGDFNVDFSVVTKKSSTLLDILAAYNMHPHVYGVTRPASGTRLDNVFTNFLDNSHFHCELSETGMSDHRAQIIQFARISNKAQVYTVGRKFADQNYDLFREYIRNESWLDVYQMSDVNDKYSALTSIFYYYFDLSFPWVRYSNISTGRHKRKVITPEMKLWSAHVRDLYLLYRNTGCREILIRYKHEKKLLSRFLTDYRKMINESRVCASSNKSKAIWSIYRELSNKGSSGEHGITKLTVEDRVITDPREIAESFASVINMGQTMATQRSYNNVHSVEHSIYLYPTDYNEVYAALMQTQKSTSPSMDGIPPKVVRSVAEYMIAPLEHIVNECMKNGCFPDGAKMARVVPIHKKGKKDVMENYRTLSILPAFSKIIEKIIHSRLVNFFSKYDILSSSHYGFLAGISTEEAVFSTIDAINNKLDEHQKVAGVYFDLTRAFDTLQHSLLTSKLESYGIRGTALALIKSYLKNRKQSVCIAGTMEEVKQNYYSQYVDVDLGVPQGSILGPFLFLVYVNDLSLHLNCQTVCQYADDTSCVISAKTIPELSAKAMDIIDRMSTWCLSNGLTLNLGKTSLVHYKRVNCDYSLYVTTSGKSIREVEHASFLGIVIDSQLQWTGHTDKLIKKLNSCCCAIRFVRNTLTVDALKIYYYAHVQSILEYGIIFWGSSIQFERIFRMQKRIIRAMLSLGFLTSCKEHFQNLKILTLPSLYIYRMAIYCRKNNKDFLKNKDNYMNMHMVTRGRETLRTPYCSQAKSQKGPYYRAVKVYNKLPSDIRQESNLIVFKNKLRNFLTEACFYSFEEYMNCSNHPII